MIKLLIKNAILTVLTLGIYRFWAKTWLRRYFWGHTRVLGEPLEYTGKASELFIGFLIVLALLIPLSMGYAALSTVASTAGPEIQVAVESAYYLIIFTLIQVGFYRMWRYRLTRTTWRGLRFGLDGSTWSYLFRSLGWVILTTVTLGLAYPWMRIALFRYRINHTRFGSGRFEFDGSGSALAGIWFTILAIPLVPTIAYFALNPGDIKALSDLSSQTMATGDPGDFRFSSQASLFLLLWLAFPILYIWYRVREFRYMVNATSFEEAFFRSHMRAWVIFVLIVAYILLIVGAGIAIVLAVMAFTFGAGLDTQEAMAAAVGLGMILWLLLIIVVAPIFNYAVIRFELTRHICNTLTIVNPDGFDRVTRSADQGPQYGEGLADAFDIGAI